MSDHRAPVNGRHEIATIISSKHRATSRPGDDVPRCARQHRNNSTSMPSRSRYRSPSWAPRSACFDIAIALAERHGRIKWRRRQRNQTPAARIAARNRLTINSCRRKIVALFGREYDEAFNREPGSADNSWRRGGACRRRVVTRAGVRARRSCRPLAMIRSRCTCLPSTQDDVKSVSQTPALIGGSEAKRIAWRAAKRRVIAAPRRSIENRQGISLSPAKASK